MTKEIEFLDTISTLVWNDISKQELVEMLKDRKEALKEQLILSGVVKSFVCDCPNESWVYDESGVDMYCKDCNEE